ncbi:Uncharacterised protein [Vibrio cholerae]|nr:Uncharacterised protein [Vibrio cholerae]
MTSRAVRINCASSGQLLTINHGSTAIQWPPTPGPGLRILTRGWRLAKRINSHTLIFNLLHTKESSLAKAMLTSRNEFSVNLAISAVRALVTMHSPFTKVLYRATAFSLQALLTPPITRSLLTSSCRT